MSPAVHYTRGAEFWIYICSVSETAIDTYMRRFRCSWDESKDRAKSRTELRELRSISMTCSLELGTCSARLSFTLRPLSSVLAGMITFAPLSAKTLAVSFPMPFVAPEFCQVKPGEKKVWQADHAYMIHHCNPKNKIDKLEFVLAINQYTKES